MIGYKYLRERELSLLTERAESYVQVLKSTYFRYEMTYLCLLWGFFFLAVILNEAQARTKAEWIQGQPC